MSKSSKRYTLKTGIALVACIALAGGLAPSLVIAKPQTTSQDRKPAAKSPPSKPVVSDKFKKEAKVTAHQTVDVIQKGTSSAHPVDDKDRLLPPVSAQPISAKDIACDEKDAAWKHLPKDLRKNAKPGECYARLLMAPQTEVVADSVVVEAERVEKRVIPAEVREVEKEVMVRPERVEKRVIPAVITTRMETEIVKPATFREEIIPAQYEIRVEQVMVSPPREEWVLKKGVPLDAPLVTPHEHRPVRYREDGYLRWPGKDLQRVEVDEEGRRYLEKGNPPEVWCLEKIPAEYRTEKRKVMIAPEEVRRIEIPAVTRQVKRRVVEQPERVEEYRVPAVYEIRRVKEVVSEERVEAYTVPAVVKDVERTRVTGQAEGVWRQVICDRNASASLVKKIQKALVAKGYDPGPIDGQLGGKTAAAMQKFQADKGLPQGQISVEAVRALGLDPVPQP